MKFTKVSETVYKTESRSREGTFHYIALFENPMYSLAHSLLLLKNFGTLAEDHRTLITCTCESFRMGIPRGGGNPFVEGCLHVKGYRKFVLGIPKKKKAKKKAKRKPDGSLGRQVRRETK